MNLEEVLAWAYGLEINVRVDSFWDGGWNVRLGDDANGYVEVSRHMELEDVPHEIVALIAKHRLSRHCSAVKTERNYESALACIDKVMDAKSGTPEMTELERLTQLVEIYEDKHFPMDALPLTT